MLPKLPVCCDCVVAHAVDAGFHPSMGSLRRAPGYSRKTMLKITRRSACWLNACEVALLCCFAAATPLAAKRAPDPAFKSLDGQTRKLSALRGQVVVVNFWATWCGPCQEELPRLSQLAADYAGKPVRFVAISIDESKDCPKIPGVFARLHVALESWTGGDTDMMDRFGLGNIVPGTAILDEQGEVVARIMGEARSEDVRTAVDWLLAGKTSPAPPALTKRY